MPGEVVLAGYLLVAEEAIAAVVDVHGVEVLRQRGPAGEVGVARVAPVASLHGGLQTTSGVKYGLRFEINDLERG